MNKIILFSLIILTCDWLQNGHNKVAGLSYCLQPGAEYGIFFSNSSHRTGKLNKVRLSIESKDIPFSLKIYQTTPEGKPLALLLKDEIKIMPTSREFEVFLGDKNIEIPKNGFLVSIKAPTTAEFRYRTHKTTRTLAYGSEEKTTDYDRLCLEATADIAEKYTWHKFPNRGWTLQSATYLDTQTSTRKPLNLLLSAEVDW